MKTVSDAQRDSQKVWSYLDRLFDWAGNRSKPMPASDLDDIRSQVTEALTRLAKRADELERAPLLRSVEIAPDGTRTITFDMRDGTTRKFQTRVDWFDESPTLSDPVPAEVIELRELLEQQIARTDEEIQKSTALRESLVARDAQLVAAEHLLVEARDRSALTADEARLAGAQAVQEDAALQILEAEIDRDRWKAKCLETAKMIESLPSREQEAIENAKGNTEAMVKEIARLEADRDQWKEWHRIASRVIDESLPVIADLLAERTRERDEALAELETLR